MSIKVLQVASEVTPIVKSGGLADVVSSLSQALVKTGHDCRIIIPKYPFLPLGTNKLTKIAVFQLANETDPDVEFIVHQAALSHSSVILYLVEMSFGLSVPTLYPTESQGEQYRYILFGRAVCEWLSQSSWQPQIIQAHDWMASPVVCHIQQINLNYQTLLTIHNAKYQGEVASDYIRKYMPLMASGREKISLLKEGILAATKINTVSPTYAKEIHTTEYGYGIEASINRRSRDVSGIINGLDIELYNTDHNPLVQPPYTFENATIVKREHRQRIMHEYDLSDESKPLFAVVGRTGSQKGMDILAEAIKESNILTKINLIILVGRGTKHIEDMLEDLSLKQPKSLKILLGFDDLVSHKIYAAADFIIMPSKYEPCGLSQLIGMRYGAIPVVRRTGGLLDTVSDISNPDGQGITYDNHSAESLLQALERAASYYHNGTDLPGLIRRNMSRDFSWDKPVLQYISLYHQMINSAKTANTPENN